MVIRRNIWIGLVVLLCWGSGQALHAQSVSMAPPQPLPARLEFLPTPVAPRPPSLAIQPEHTFHPKRLWYGLGGAVAVDAIAMVGLSQLWYSGAGWAPFAFYSERLETRYPDYESHGWLDDWYTYVQQDKLGHMWTAWQLARAVGAYGRWTGLSNEKSGLLGGVVAALFQTQIEIFDGFSPRYGFSRTDMLANIMGGAVGGLKVAYPEKLDWFAGKYSYHMSPYYGKNFDSGGIWGYLGNAIKDYGGISYWIVIRPEELLPEQAAERWPDWLAFSLGYSGEGLQHEISGHGNTPLHQRQIYLSVDLDFLHTLDVPEPWNTLADLLSFIRIPAPALELTPTPRWHWLYY